MSESNPLRSDTSRLHRRQCLRTNLTFSWRSSGDSNSGITLTKGALYQLSYKTVEAGGGNDPPTERYECSVFPTKLTRRCRFTSWMFRMISIHPVFLPLTAFFTFTSAVVPSGGAVRYWSPQGFCRFFLVTLVTEWLTFY